MISRIRLEAVGFSTSEVARELEIAWQQFALAAYYEGITPQSSRVTEEVVETITNEDGSLEVKGRRIVKFDLPDHLGGAPTTGGLAQTDWEIEGLKTVSDYRPHGLFGHPGSEKELVREEIDPKMVIILDRLRPVTRDSAEE